jgi:hypothetical protein
MRKNNNKKKPKEEATHKLVDSFDPGGSTLLLNVVSEVLSGLYKVLYFRKYYTSQ